MDVLPLAKLELWRYNIKEYLKNAGRYCFEYK